MPKKKSISQKEDVLEELAEKLKASAEKKGKEGEGSGLEEDVDDESLKLQTLEFHQFMNALEQTETKAPVLERMALSAPRPIFVGGIPQGIASEEGNGKSDEFKYVPGNADANEPKYIETTQTFETATERIDPLSVGRNQEFFSQVNQNALFRNSELKEFQSQDMERVGRVERFDTERAGRRNSFEREEAKYEKYKPKFPKG